MDTVLSQMDIDDPSANVDKDTEMGDVAPRAVQKQEKQKKDKTDRKEKKEKSEKKKDKKTKSSNDDAVETRKRKHVEVNGAVASEGKKKKKKKSTVE
jgi:nucleolar protein 56